jgi:hypothetical protein
MAQTEQAAPRKPPDEGDGCGNTRMHLLEGGGGIEAPNLEEGRERWRNGNGLA